MPYGYIIALHQSTSTTTTTTTNNSINVGMAVDVSCLVYVGGGFSRGLLLLLRYYCYYCYCVIMEDIVDDDAINRIIGGACNPGQIFFFGSKNPHPAILGSKFRRRFSTGRLSKHCLNR